MQAKIRAGSRSGTDAHRHLGVDTQRSGGRAPRPAKSRDVYVHFDHDAKVGAPANAADPARHGVLSMYSTSPVSRSQSFDTHLP
jgi:hypothetical protein